MNKDVQAINEDKLPTRKYSLLEKFWNYLKDEYDFIYTINRRYSDFDYWRRRTFKYFFQRANKGWAENDTWDLNNYLAKVISESIEYLANNLTGYPMNETPESWEKKLKEVSKAFKDYYEYDDNWMKRQDELKKKYNIPERTYENILSDDPKYRVPLDVQQQFYDNEEKIKIDIKERMKQLIEIYDGLWD